uniref:Uncharacterized protein n=1 Tax=Oryza meridionalis TaxID=40149 RepID=A0A0E0D175_9ORYZ
MGLPLEQWCGGEAAGVVVAAGKKESASSAAGCRTPGGGGGAQEGGRGAAAGECPGAPRKRRAAPGPVSQMQEQHRQRRDFYSGPDVDAFFAAHNL